MSMKTNKKLEDEVDKMFDKAIAQWSTQGRTDDQIWAIRNFFTGRGTKAKQEVLTLLQAQRTALIEEVLKQETHAGDLVDTTKVVPVAAIKKLGEEK